MGLFDSVFSNCPACGRHVEHQTKADDDPYMNVYNTTNAPTHLLIDVLNKPERCSCGAWSVLVDPAFPVRPLRPNPKALIVKPPPDEESRRNGSYYWWPDGHEFEIDSA